MFSVEELVIQHRSQKITVVNVKRRADTPGRTDGMGILYMGYESVFLGKPPPWLRQATALLTEAARRASGGGDGAGGELVSGGSNMHLADQLQTILDTGAIKLIRTACASGQSDLEKHLRSVPVWVFNNAGPNIYYPQLEGMKAIEDGDLDGDDEAGDKTETSAQTVTSKSLSRKAPQPINRSDSASADGLLNLNNSRQFSIIRYEDLSDSKKSMIMIQTPERETIHSFDDGGAKIRTLDDGALSDNIMSEFVKDDHTETNMADNTQSPVSVSAQMDDDELYISSDTCLPNSEHTSVQFSASSSRNHPTSFPADFPERSSEQIVMMKDPSNRTVKLHFETSPESPKIPVLSSPTISKFLRRDNPQMFMNSLREGMSGDFTEDDLPTTGEYLSRCRPKAHAQGFDEESMNREVDIKEMKLKAKLAESALYKTQNTSGASGDAPLSLSNDVDSGIWDMIQGKDVEQEVMTSPSRGSTPVLHYRSDDSRQIAPIISDIQELNINDMLLARNPLETSGDKPSIAYRAFKVDCDANEVILSKAKVATYLPLLDEPTQAAISENETDIRAITEAADLDENCMHTAVIPSDSDEYESAYERRSDAPTDTDNAFETAFETAVETAGEVSEEDFTEPFDSNSQNMEQVKEKLAKVDENQAQGMVNEGTQTSPVREVNGTSGRVRKSSVHRQRSYAQAILLENAVTSPEDSEGSGWQTAKSLDPPVSNTRRVPIKPRRKKSTSKNDQPQGTASKSAVFDTVMSSSDIVSTTSEENSPTETESACVSTNGSNTPTEETFADKTNILDAPKTSISADVTPTAENIHLLQENISKNAQQRVIAKPLRKKSRGKLSGSGSDESTGVGSYETSSKQKQEFPAFKTENQVARPILLVTDIPNAIEINEKHADFVDSATKADIKEPEMNSVEPMETLESTGRTAVIDIEKGEANIETVSVQSSATKAVENVQTEEIPDVFKNESEIAIIGNEIETVPCTASQITDDSFDKEELRKDFAANGGCPLTQSTPKINRKTSLTIAPSTTVEINDVRKEPTKLENGHEAIGQTQSKLNVEQSVPCTIQPHDKARAQTKFIETNSLQMHPTEVAPVECENTKDKTEAGQCPAQQSRDKFEAQTTVIEAEYLQTNSAAKSENTSESFKTKIDEKSQKNLLAVDASNEPSGGESHSDESWMESEERRLLECDREDIDASQRGVARNPFDSAATSIHEAFWSPTNEREENQVLRQRGAVDKPDTVTHPSKQHPSNAVQDHYGKTKPTLSPKPTVYAASRKVPDKPPISPKPDKYSRSPPVQLPQETSTNGNIPTSEHLTRGTFPKKPVVENKSDFPKKEKTGITSPAAEVKSPIHTPQSGVYTRRAPMPFEAGGVSSGMRTNRTAKPQAAKSTDGLNDTRYTPTNMNYTPQRPASIFTSRFGQGFNTLPTAEGAARSTQSLSVSVMSPSGHRSLLSPDRTSPAPRSESRGSSRSSEGPYMVASYNDGSDWGDESLLWDADEDDDDVIEMTSQDGGQEAELGEIDNFPDWMAELAPRLHDVPLASLSIPGAHISFAIERDLKTDMDIAKSNYEMAEFLRKLPNLSIFNNFRSLIKQIWKAWMPKQALSLAAQLQAGIRYLDIRVTRYRSALYAEHGLYSKPLIKYLKQIKLFLDAHPKEIVILHFEALNQIDMRDKRRLVTSLFQIFGARMAKVTQDINKVTLNALWRRKKQVLVVFPAEDLQLLHNHIFVGLIWSDALISAHTPKAQTQQELHSFLDSTYYNAQSLRGKRDSLQVTRAVLNPDMSMLFGEFQYQSMRELTLNETHTCIANWLEHKSNVNIVAFDFVGASGLIERIIRLNDLKFVASRQTAV